MNLNLPAHSAGKWGPKGCQACPQMEAAHGAIMEQSEKQREGDAAHYVFAESFRSSVPVVGSLAPNGFVISLEMLECASDIVRDIADTMKAASETAQLYIEYSFHPRQSVSENNTGRGDAVIIDVDRKRVFIWEYKYGHRFVDAVENWQLINCAIGAMENLGIAFSDWTAWQFVATVAQPRNYHPDGPLREWHFSGDDLQRYCGGLQEAATLCLSDRPIMTTGDHCRDCDARHACAALQKVAMNYVDLSLEMTPQELPPAALGVFLKTVLLAQDRLKALREGLEEQALSKLRSGQDIPHFKADYSQGREKWNVSASEVIALGEALGVDLSKPVASLTPHQARKAGLPPELVKSFADRPRGSLALIPFSTEDAARRFK